MANYNLTNQTISGSFEQLVQHDNDTNILYDGTGSVINNLEVTSSFATTASYAINHDDPTWDEIQNKPAGIVSGSSQIILQDTTGDLSGSRINEAVALATTASHALFSEEAENAEHADAVQFPVIAKETLTKGDPVYVSGYSNGEGKPEVLKADASDSSKMPVVGLAMVNASNNDHIFISVAGNFSDVDTDTGLTNPQVGDTLYVASGGGYTNVKPTGTDLIQNIGVIGRVQQNNGEIVVSAIQRSNDLPNITSGYAWVGDSNGVPQAVSTASWDAALTELNTFTASYYIDSASFDTRIDALVVSGSGADWNTNLINIPSGIISGSEQLPSGIISGSEQLPSGLVSGSDQLSGSFARLDAPNLFIDTQTIESTLIVSQSAGITGSIMHFPQTGGGGLQGLASNRFYNPGGPNLFEQSYQGIDKYVLQTVGTGEMEISAATSMVLNPATSGNGQLVSTKIMTQQDSAISGTGQKDSITIGAYTGSNGVIYTSNLFGLQNYPSDGINNAFVIGKYNSSFNKVSEARVDEGKVQLTIGNGDFDYDFIQIADNNQGQTQITLKSDFIVGTGNTGINNVNIGVNHPTSQSLFVADGASPRIQVYSQTDAASSGINIELTGATSVDDLVINGKVSSELQPVGVSNNTASIDFEAAQMAVVDLPASGDTLFNLVGPSNGQVLNLLVKQGGNGTVSLPSNLKMASGSAYSPTNGAGSRDLLTFATYDYSSTNEIYLVNAVNLV